MLCHVGWKDLTAVSEDDNALIFKVKESEDRIHYLSCKGIEFLQHVLHVTCNVVDELSLRE